MSPQSSKFTFQLCSKTPQLSLLMQAAGVMVGPDSVSRGLLQISIIIIIIISNLLLLPLGRLRNCTHFPPPMSLHHSSHLDVLVAGIGLVTLYLIFHMAAHRRPTTALAGPPSTNFLVGVAHEFVLNEDPPSVHNKWSETYGPAFSMPRGFGRPKAIVLCDPRAVQHFHARETSVYVNLPFKRKILANIVCRSLSRCLQTH